MLLPIQPENIDHRRRMWELRKELEIFEISKERMADQVRTIITKKWFTAEELDKIGIGEKHQNKDEDSGTSLEGNGPRLKSLNFHPRVVIVAPVKDKHQ